MNPQTFTGFAKAPGTGIVPFAATMLERLDLVLRLRFWEYRTEPMSEEVIPGLSRRVRLHRSRRGAFWKEGRFVVDVVRRSDLHAPWGEVRARVAQARASAARCGDGYWILTDRSVSAEVAANLRRLLPYQERWFDEAVTQALIDAMLPGAPMTMGILLRRVTALGYSPRQVEGDLMHLLARRIVWADLNQPLGWGTLLKYGSPRSPQPPRGSDPRNPPPWIGYG